MTTVEFTSTVLGDEGAISSDISRTIVWAIAGEDIAAGKVVRLKQSTTGATVEVYDYVGTPDQDLPPYGIALETTTTGNSIPVIISGMVPNSVTGILTAATTDPVTVSSAGVPTRNAAFLGTDWVLGVVDTQARLILSKPRLGFEYRGTVRTVDNVTALRALTGHTEQTVVLSGYTTADGLGSGIFFWDTASAADDDGTRFNVGGFGTSSAGWKRVFTGPRHVTWFGATGDGVTDDTSAIDRAVESLRYTGGTMFFPRGVYLISSQLSFVAANVGEYDNIVLQGEGVGSQIKCSVGIGDQLGAYGPIVFSGKVVPLTRTLLNVGIRDMRLTGAGESEQCGSYVVFSYSDGCFVERVFFDEHAGEGVHWTDARVNTNGRVTDCFAYHMGGYSVDSANQPVAAYNPNCDNVKVTGNIAYKCGFAVEHTGRSGIYTNNIFDDFGYTHAVTGFNRLSAFVNSNLIGFTDPSDRLIVSNNVIRNASAGISINTAGSFAVCGNTIESCENGIQVGDAGPGGVISGNTLYETIGTSSGTAIQLGGSGATSQSVTVAGNTVIAGAIPWARGVRVLDDTAPHIIRNNTFVGQCFTTRGIQIDSNNTASQVLDNEFMTGSWAVYGAAIFYEWRGQNLTYNGGIDGIRNGIRLSTVQPSIARADSSPPIGTWSVGDQCINTVPTAGAPFGWVCTVAGTPGTWVPFGYGLALGAADEVLQVNGAGTLTEWGKIADANIATNAAIAITKLAGGTKHREMMSWNENGDIWTIDPGQLRTIYEWRPSVGAAFGVFSGWDQVTTNGTPSHPGMGTGSFLAQSRRTQMETGVGANDIAGFESVPVAWRGTGGLGGFFFWARFAMSTSTAGTRCFIGLAESGGNANCAADPGDASSSNCIGVGYDAADANWQVIRADGVPNVTKVNTGLAKDGVTVLELRMFCNPSASEIFVQLYNFNLGEFVVNTSYNTTLPTDSMTLSAFAYCGTAASAVAQDLQLYGLRIESHY